LRGKFIGSFSNSCSQIPPPPQGFLHGLNLSGVRARLAALIRRVLRVSGAGMKSHYASAPQGVEQKATKVTKKEIPIFVCFVFFCKSFCLFGSTGDFPVRPPP
jgi:hypothetical protein